MTNDAIRLARTWLFVLGVGAGLLSVTGGCKRESGTGATKTGSGGTTAPSAAPAGAVPSALPAAYVKKWEPRVSAPVTPAEKLRVGYLPATHDSLLFVAAANGFFKSSGVDVDLIRYENSPAALVALEAGEIDVAIPGIAAPLYRVAVGAKLKIIGGEAWYSAAVVAPPQMAPPDSATDPAELLAPFKGKKVGTVTQSTGDAIFRGKVQVAGLAPDIKIVTYTSPPQLRNALTSGEVDAAVLWSPHMTDVENASGGRLKTVLWTSRLQIHPCCRQVVTADHFGRRRAALTRYMAGIVLAKQFMLDPANKAATLTAVRTYVQSVSEKVLERELFEYDVAARHRRTELSPNNSPQQVSDYAEMMIQSKLIAPKSVERVRESVDASILADAYRLVFPELTAEQADACARSGLVPAEITNAMKPVIGAAP